MSKGVKDSTTLSNHTIRWIGLIAGPALAGLCVLFLSDQYQGTSEEEVAFTFAGRATLGAMVWMGVWWLTEAIDISATALLPIVLFPLIGIARIDQATSPYADDLIFLFMGGFLLALSMQRWALDRRIALITLRMVGTKPVNMVAGFMLVTAVLSAFVSNTATTAMMLPVAISVIDVVRRNKRANNNETEHQEIEGNDATSGRNFSLCLMLGIAYAASIGGLSTIIGTPPNGFLVAFMSQEIGEAHRMDIGFVEWLPIGLPLTIIFLPLVWLLLTRVVYPVRMPRIEGGRALLQGQYRELGPVKRGERVTFVVFTCTAMLWMLRPIIQKGIKGDMDPATGEQLFVIPPLIPGISDAGIAMLAGLLLFVIPVDVKSRTFTMNWKTAKKMPWGIFILFGGGLSLAAAVKANGVAEFIGSLTAGFAGSPDWVLVLLVVTMMIFLTELTSNTATTATLVPILAGLGVGMGIHPYLLIIPAALAASCAFMMPVATPPNAIVFGSGHVTIPQMCKAGLWLNIIAIVLVTLVSLVLIPFVLGV